MGVITMHANVYSAISASGIGGMLCCFFFNGRAADGGIILLRALPVFCVVLKEKHIYYDNSNPRLMKFLMTCRIFSSG